MQILGKEISDRCAEAVAQLEDMLNKPVEYHLTDVAQTKSFGWCDLSRPEAYHIYSKESLFKLTKAKVVNPAFEANLIHQLLRACQAVEGFPAVETKVTELTRPSLDFYEQMGRLFTDGVYDLNVDKRMGALGFTLDYFYKHSINQADKMVRKGWRINNELDFARFACQLTLLKLTCPGAQIENLLKLMREQNAGLAVQVNRMAEQMAQVGWSDGEETLGALAILFSSFNLWLTHRILYQGKAFEHFDAVREAFPELKLPDLAQ